MPTELWQRSIADAADAIRSGEVSPVQLTESYLERIQRVDGRYHAYITVMADQARAAARQAEAELASGHYRGPLHGIPIAAKDLIYTKDAPTSAGSTIFREHRPSFDATIIQRLQDAGAILLGKTNLHEFAYGTTGVNITYGTPENPWGAGRLPGGSSSGSAVALAAGLCAGAIGSDTGGSIRIPASLCSVVGIKPTYGRVSRYGVFPLAWSLDTLGPMARTVEDAALLLNVLAGHDPLDPMSVNTPVPDYRRGLQNGVRGLRIGVPRDYFFSRIDPEVRAAVDEAIATLEGLGARVTEVSLPHLDHLTPIYSPLIQSEAAAFHLPLLRKHWNSYSPQVRSRLLPGLAIPASIYLKSQRAKNVALREYRALMQQVDLLVTPTEPVAAPRVDATAVEWEDGPEEIIPALGRFARPFNLLGVPACSLPCGFTREGLPIGLQLAGRAWDEATVLRAAYTYEQATEWHERTPEIKEH